MLLGDIHRDTGYGDPGCVEARVLLGEIREQMFGRSQLTTVGRFTLQRLLGRGTHGSVYLAEDPELRRRVAVKLLRAPNRGPTARARLLREAQALAQLKHPNVLTIHEVGVEGDRIFIAMEFVEVGTLASWCREHPPDARARFGEVVGLAIGAARGLAAAHQAGIVHRDIKPANILLGVDGRPRIADFGLARASADDALPFGEGVTDTRQTPPTDAQFCGTLTRTGEVVGTPAYMAPEQFSGKGDAASDQFSLCATFWEAAYGQRPFDGPTAARIAAASSGPLVPPPATRTEVPGWWREILARGLSADPGDRWPSVGALLSELERRRRRGPRWFVAAGVVAIAAGGLGVQAWAAARAKRCSGAATQLAGTWDAARRGQAQSAVLATGLPYAADAWQHAAAEIDAYAGEWKRMHTEACEATTLRGEQSAELMDLQMACLHRAKMQLAAVTDLLADADAEVVKNTASLVGGLAELAQCADVDALHSGVEPPLPQDEEAVHDIMALLAKANAEVLAGKLVAAQVNVAEAKERLIEVSYPPAYVQAALEEGDVLKALGQYAASEAAFREALERAAKGRQLDVVQEAAAKLIHVVGYEQHRTEEGLGFGEIAIGLAGQDPAREAAARNNLAAVMRRQGRFAEAEVEYRHALELRERALGPSHPNVAITRHNLAIALEEQGKYEESEAQHRLALAHQRDALGAAHPDVAPFHNGLATSLDVQGKHAEAEAEYRRGLALARTALGATHPNVAKMRSNLADVLESQGQFAEAEAEYTAVLELLERALGAAHPDVARGRNNLAILFRRQGKPEAAEAQYRLALESLDAALRPGHPMTVTVRRNLATILSSQEKYAEAEVELRRMLGSILAARGTDHPDSARARSELASVLLERGKAREALRLAERAWTQHQRADTLLKARAKTAFVLARALWAADSGAQARRRARELARDSLEAFAASAEPSPEDRAEVGAWLHAHRAD